MRPQQAKRLTPHSSPSIKAGQASGPAWTMPYAESPRYIQLETVTVCNAKCPFCPQHEIKRQPPRMPRETWQKIIDDTRGLGITYRPFLTNEPFVDKRQPEIVRYIKEHDPTAKVEYNTNGELMTAELGRALLEAGVDILRFSIDGLSQEIYEPSRLGVSWEKVYERVPRFLAMWDSEGYREQCYTEVRMIEVPENRHEIEDYLAFWGDKCSEVVITQMYQWPWTGQRREDVIKKPCLKILDEMFFYSDGDATLCCWDVHGRAVIGNVHQESVLDIWSGFATRQLRALLDDGRRDLLHLCSRCNAYEDFDFSQFRTGGEGHPSGKKAHRNLEG